jgi:hypothetical protein
MDINLVSTYFLILFSFVPHISFMAKDQHHERRILIFQPRDRDSTHPGVPKDFDIVGTYPPYDPMKGLEDATLIYMNNYWEIKGHEAG